MCRSCDPRFQFWEFLHFQPCFGQNSSPLDPNFSKFSFTRPPFFKENPLPRPYILKPARHTSTKKKVECPRGRSPPCPPVAPPLGHPYWILLVPSSSPLKSNSMSFFARTTFDTWKSIVKQTVNSLEHTVPKIHQNATLTLFENLSIWKVV